jgi:hypothetical protein
MMPRTSTLDARGDSSVSRVGGKITVVVPAWDLGDLLVAALESIRQQRAVARIIVVDNCSARVLSSGDAEVIRLDRRLTVGAARNAALPLVRTPYVCFMDGDDVLLPGALDRLASLLDDNPSLVAAAGAIELWDPDTNQTAPSFYPPPIAWRLQHRRSLFRLANTVVNLFPPVGGSVIRVEAARAAGGFPDLSYLETWCFGVALTELGPTLLDPAPAKLYRVDPGRDTLKSSGVGRFASEWTGRATLRKTVRQMHGQPARCAVGMLLLPIHGVQVALAMRRRRPRQVDVLQALRSADRP